MIRNLQLELLRCPFRWQCPSPLHSPHLSKQGTLIFQNLLDEKDFLFCGHVRTLFLLDSSERPNCLVGFFLRYTEVNKKLDNMYLHHPWCIHSFRKMGLSIYSVDKKILLHWVYTQLFGWRWLENFLSWGRPQRTVLSWWRPGPRFFLGLRKKTQSTYIYIIRSVWGSRIRLLVHRCRWSTYDRLNVDQSQRQTKKMFWNNRTETKLVVRPICR